MRRGASTGEYHPVAYNQAELTDLYPVVLFYNCSDSVLGRNTPRIRQSCLVSSLHARRDPNASHWFRHYVLYDPVNFTACPSRHPHFPQPAAEEVAPSVLTVLGEEMLLQCCSAY